jgi:hypothetical protein
MDTAADIEPRSDREAPSPARQVKRVSSNETEHASKRHKTERAAAATNDDVGSRIWSSFLCSLKNELKVANSEGIVWSIH